jgi:gliding motility-associated-like protein
MADGSTSSSYTIDQAGIYTLTISNVCGEVSDDIEVFNFPEPIIDFEDDTIFLCEGENYEFNFDPSLGDYIWQDGYVGPDYSIADEGQYSVELINPCGTDYDEFTVVVRHPPIVSLGPDITLCPQQLPYIINLSGLPEADQFLWSDGDTNPMYVVNGTGTISIIVSNECFQDSDMVNITIADSSVNVSLPADTTLCTGEMLLLDISHISGNYHWQDNSSLSSYTISQNGMYSVTVSNVCGSGSDSIMVLFDDQLPILDLGPDFNLCPGEQAIINPGLTGVNYLWNAGSTADTFLVTDADTLILSISNQCSAISDTLVINLNAMAPDAGLPDQLSLCEGDTLNIGTAILGANYIWSNGQTSANISITLPGQYILTVTNACGSDIDTTEILDLGAAPLFDLGPDQTICEGDIISFGPGIPGNYTWNNGSSNSSITVTDDGTYSLTISNACGMATDSVIILLSPAIPDLEFGPDISICTGDTTVLSPGISNVNYLWQNGMTTDSFIITGSGLIELTISNFCGSNTDSLMVNEISNPILELGNDTVACEGETILLSPGIADVNYLWSDGSSNSSLLLTSSDTIQLEIENECGVAKDSIVVTIEGIVPVADLGQDTLICDGQIITLSIDDPGSTIVWQDGSTVPTQVISTSGQYAVSVSNSCGEAHDTINVTSLFSPAPFDLGPDQVICEGQSVTLNAPDTGTSDLLNWNTGSSASSIDILEEGQYSLTVSNECGMISDEIEFELDTQEIQLAIDHQFLICDGEQVTLDVGQSFPTQYLWSTGSGESSISAHDVGHYQVTITSQCDQAQDEFIVVKDDCGDDIYIPNLYSPNGDQVNDEFKIGWGNIEVSSFEISIYDRWGEIVFNSKDPNFKWDGRLNGKALNPGVFVYKIMYQQNDLDQKEELRIGDVTIIK